MSAADERRRNMDSQMASVMANHATILGNHAEIELSIRHQHKCIEELKREVAAFKAVVQEVRDIMAAMHVSFAVFKYIAIVGGAILSAWHGIKAAWRAFW